MSTLVYYITSDGCYSYGSMELMKAHTSIGHHDVGTSFRCSSVTFGFCGKWNKRWWHPLWPQVSYFMVEVVVSPKHMSVPEKMKLDRVDRNKARKGSLERIIYNWLIMKNLLLGKVLKVPSFLVHFWSVPWKVSLGCVCCVLILDKFCLIPVQSRVGGMMRHLHMKNEDVWIWHVFKLVRLHLLLLDK